MRQIRPAVGQSCCKGPAGIPVNMQGNYKQASQINPVNCRFTGYHLSSWSMLEKSPPLQRDLLAAVHQITTEPRDGAWRGSDCSTTEDRLLDECLALNQPHRARPTPTDKTRQKAIESDRIGSNFVGCVFFGRLWIIDVSTVCLPTFLVQGECNGWQCNLLAGLLQHKWPW